MKEFEHSGYSLVDEVRALAPGFVVDAGCGYNLFKGKIPNLIGIDIVNPAADLVCDISEAPIRTASIDVVLALGSINYGNHQVIVDQLQTVADWLKENGTLIMRVIPAWLPAGTYILSLVYREYRSDRSLRRAPP